jgi:predicted ATPase with chaperone activity
LPAAINALAGVICLGGGTQLPSRPEPKLQMEASSGLRNLRDAKGQETAKWVLEVAANSGHIMLTCYIN